MIETFDIPIFSTPILISKYSNHKNHRFENFEKNNRKPKNWITSVNTSFPNVSLNDPYIKSNVISEVKSNLLKHLKNVMSFHNIPNNIDYSDFWYNAYYEGQGQEMHHHLSVLNDNPFWCGIYFAMNCFNGQLFFSRTDLSHRTQKYCNWKDTKLSHYYDDDISIGIEDGSVLLFPPHLMHSVKVDYRNRDDMRLTFSFNLKLGQKNNYKFKGME